MKPHILILMHYLEIGGAETALVGLLNALDKERVDVDLFLHDHRGEMMQFIPDWVQRNFVNAGPLDFVKLISKAQYVISNSFHATAFSLILERNFCVVNRKDGINERMKSILEDVGLGHRILSAFTSEQLKNIDYTEVNEKLSDIICFSKSWLNKVLR